MKGSAIVLSATAASLGAAGCANTTLQTVRVPVPVECRVQVPARPAMPTESHAPGVSLDRFAASAMGEIELREGCGHELRGTGRLH